MTEALPPSRFAPQIACLLILVALVDSQLVASIAPQIATGIGASETQVASGVTVYSVFAAVVALGLAWSPRQHEPARRLPLAAVLFAIATVTTALAPHLLVYYAGRAVAGLAGGLISALAIAALANASSYDRRGSQMSWVAVAYFLAPVLGVPLGAVLTGQIGWRGAFLVNTAAAVMAGLLVAVFPLADRRAGEALADDASPRGARAAVGRLWGFANRSVSARMGVVSAFFVSGGLVGFTAYLGIWLHDAFGATPAGVGLVYAAAGLGAVAGGAAGGKMADRYGKRRIALGSSTALWLAIPLVPSLAWGGPLFAMVAVAAFVASLRVAPLQALVTELVDAPDRPAYIALRNASSQLGIAAAVAVGGVVYSRFGMMGVALACAAVTILAWVTVSFVRDPGHAARPARSTRIAARLARATAMALVFTIVALPFFLSFLVTKARTRPDERNLPQTPASYGAVYEDVSFAADDGARLSGWLLASNGAGATIVMTHGLFRSRFELLERGCDLWRLGYGVLLFDVRRHGASTGEFSTIGYRERFDVEAAARLVRERAPRDRLVLFGVSMGAAATLLAASETDGISAVVADSSFLSLRHTVTHHLSLAGIPTLPFAPMLVWMTAARMGFMPGSFDVREAVARVGCPILFVGGTNDRRMPVDSVLEPLAGAARNPGSRRLVVSGAGHGHAYDTDRGLYISTVNGFLQEALAAAPPG